MKKYKKYIDDLFREKVAHESNMPPDDVWEALDKKLDGLVPSPPPASYRWLHYFAIASLVLLLTVLVVKKISVNAATKQTNGEEDASIRPQQPATDGVSHPTNETNTGAVATNAAAVANNATAPTKIIAAGNTGTQQTVHDNNAVATAAASVPVDALTQTQQPGEKKTGIAATGKRKQATTSVVNTIHGHRQPAAGTGSTSSSIAAATTTPSLLNDDNSINNTGNNTAQPTANSNEIAAVTKQTPAPQAPVAEQKLLPLPAGRHKAHVLPERKLEEGIKAGYEGGTDRYAASKYTVSPYLQVNLSSKISLLFQPALKYAQLSTRDVGSPQSYYSVNNDGTVTQNGASVLSTTTQGGTTDSFYTTKYTYRETHDSIVKSYSAGGAYLEFELPVLLKYYLTKKIAVFGGVNILYSKLTGIRENTYTEHGIASTLDYTQVTSTLPTALPAHADLSYTGTPYSAYNGPLYHAAPAAQLHIGYMIGFSYEYNRRWLIDGSLEQSPVNAQTVGAYNMNAPLSATYFRLAIGYRLQDNVHIFGKSETGRGD